jgi:hypothetical protein
MEYKSPTACHSKLSNETQNSYNLEVSDNFRSIFSYLFLEEKEGKT